MAMIYISDAMANAVESARLTYQEGRRLERYGVTNRIPIVCSSQTMKALVARGLVEGVERPTRNGLMRFSFVLTQAGELLRNYLKAGGEQRSFGENQLTDPRLLPRDMAGDTVRAQQSAEDPAPESVCGNRKDPITTCERPAGHDGQHRNTFALFTDSLFWGPGEFATDLEPTVCGAHPRFEVPTSKPCQRVPGHPGRHRNTPRHTRSSVYWGVNESSDKCGVPIAPGDTAVILCDLKPGHDGVHSSRPVPSRTGGKDMIVTHESATAHPSAVVTVCGRRIGETNAQRCTLNPGHTGECSHLAQSARTPEPTDDHVSHTVKIWYSSGAYEEVGPLPAHHAATIYAECENNERVAAAEIHGHVHELIRSHLRG